MSNIIRLKIQNSEFGHNVCIWLDTGDIEMFPVEGPAAEIVERFQAGEIEPEELLAELRKSIDQKIAIAEAGKAVSVRLEKVSERLSCDGMHVYFDNASFEKIRLDSALEKHLIRLMTERNQSASAMRDWQSYAAFTENLYSNVDERIREQFVKWLEAQDWLTFTEDGCFIGYKGCQKNPDTGIAESIKCGPGVVNGAVYNGHIPNPDGAIVEIDRSLVENDPSVGCASGMHVGTYDYAKNWGNGVLLRVKVNPRDVISVPFDCDAQKIRCCRYEVLDHEEYEYEVDYDRSQMTWWFDDTPEYDWCELEDWCAEDFKFDPYDCMMFDEYEQCSAFDGEVAGDGCRFCKYFEDEYDEQFSEYCWERRDEFEEYLMQEMYDGRKEYDDNSYDCGCCCDNDCDNDCDNGCDNGCDYSDECDSGCDCGGGDVDKTCGVCRDYDSVFGLNGNAGAIQSGAPVNTVVSNDIDVIGSLEEAINRACVKTVETDFDMCEESDDIVESVVCDTENVDTDEVTGTVSISTPDIIMDTTPNDFDGDVNVIEDLEKALGIK